MSSTIPNGHVPVGTGQQTPYPMPTPGNRIGQPARVIPESVKRRMAERTHFPISYLPSPTVIQAQHRADQDRRQTTVRQIPGSDQVVITTDAQRRHMY
jgi:hypothetical protein